MPVLDSFPTVTSESVEVLVITMIAILDVSTVIGEQFLE